MDNQYQQPQQYPQAGYQQPHVQQPEQSQQPAVRYGGFWRRVISYLIDMTVISLVAKAITIGEYQADVLYSLDLTDLAVGTITTVFTWVVSLIYFPLMESSYWQATVGKLAMGLMVTDANGLRITAGRAFGRYFAKFISGIIIGIGFLMAGFTAGKRALHDMIAGTYVIERYH